jgi:hypothetical protein
MISNGFRYIKPDFEWGHAAPKRGNGARPFLSDVETEKRSQRPFVDLRRPLAVELRHANLHRRERKADLDPSLGDAGPPPAIEAIACETVAG